nr:FtsX-like permease family protein [uncultured Steroidobacter sp.]
MKSLPLILSALRRKPARTFLTMFGVVIAFVLFGLLQGVDSAFAAALDRMKLDRLLVDARFSQPLPISYRARIQNVPGVTRIAEIQFLGGHLQDEKRRLLSIATDPETWLSFRPEYTVPRSQIEAVKRTRNGAIITDWTAREYGLKIGDQFTLRTQMTNVTGGSDWNFVVVGIMTYFDPTQHLTVFLSNYKYIDEGRVTDRGTANRFLLGISDPRDSTRVSRAIDALFATSGVQTRTQSEHEMGQLRMAAMGDISFFTRSIISAVFFTLLILTANTMMESVRERTSEFAVLKTLGYTDEAVFGLVILESILLCVTASLVGLALAAAAFPFASTYFDTTGLFPPVVIAAGVGLATGLALISAAIPGWRALRLKVVDALVAR